MPIDVNEAVLATKITGPGQRATLSAVLGDGMKAATIRVNDVEGVAGFILPGDHVDVLLTRTGDKNVGITDVVITDVRVLAIDQLADQKTDKPSVVKAVTLEVNVTDGEKVALASTVGTLSLLLSKAGETADADTRRVTTVDLGKPSDPAPDSRFVNVVGQPAVEEFACRIHACRPSRAIRGRRHCRIRRRCKTDATPRRHTNHSKRSVLTGFWGLQRAAGRPT